MKISTSILSIKENLKENIKKLAQSSTDYIHLDIMDGVFVPSKTWDFASAYDIIEGINKPLDIHLMVKDLDRYIEAFSSFHPIFLTFHYEATSNIKKYIAMIREKGIKVGISIKPDTDVEVLKPYLKDIDLVLVMSVIPGAGGQSFILNSVNKIQELSKLKKEESYDYIIEVDGGINAKTVSLVREAGVDIVVSGSYITNGDNYEERILNLKQKDKE